MKKLIFLLIFFAFLSCKKQEICISNMQVEFLPVQIYGNDQNEGIIMSFENRCKNFRSLYWDFGDGCTAYNTDKIIYHNYDNEGSYQVTLTAEDVCNNIFTTSEEIFVLYKPD